MKVLKWVTGILVFVFLNTAVSAYAFEKQEYPLDFAAVSDTVSGGMASDIYFFQKTGKEQTGWQDIEGEKYYFSQETGAMQTGWQDIEGKKYYFSPETGVMQTGWQDIEGERYYFSPETGAVQAGWQDIEGEKYYFSLETGAMQTGWQEDIAGWKYYFSPETGAVQTGWQDIEGERYYFSPETGAVQTGWQEDLAGWKYYFSPETGAMQKNWQDIEGERYYFSLETGAVQTGWQKIQGETYYFSAETGAMQTGWQKIQGKKYYFSPETGGIVTGWQDIGGENYYFSAKTGYMYQGRQKIGKKTYLFKGNGSLCTGWTRSGNKTYYSGKNGVLAAGWKKIDGSQYYFFPKNNQMAAGSCQIKNSYYIFRQDGRLAQSKGITIVRAGGSVFFAGADGKAVSGWQIKNNKLYYTSQKGIAKKNTTYQGIVFMETGAAVDNFTSRCKTAVIQALASVTDKSMAMDEKLRACWSYLTGGTFRYASKYPNLSEKGWQKRTACDMLSTHMGNCYSFACAFAALASEIGYKPYVVCGRVRGSRDRSPDGYTRHAWVMINGMHYDPEAQYAGWMRGVYARNSYPAAHQIQQTLAYHD